MGRKLTQEEFIERCKKVHGDNYDYSLVEYKNCKSKVKIICKEHGIFEQVAETHTAGFICPKCSGHKTIDELLVEAKAIHGDNYDYSLVEYKKKRDKVKIKCNNCGTIFEQTLFHHINRMQGCINCYNSRNSRGSQEIKKILDNNNIPYLTEFWFTNCRGDKKPLHFDFYMPDYNVIMEYQGEQHYKIAKHWGGIEKFKKQQKYDQIKRDFCKDKKIKLLEITYQDDIKEKLKEEFFWIN
ncbi:MAG: hypothetical protein LBF97_00655 [Elusimicrobiota bacterium]|jgi:protein-arginine kinase activator protein McsA|nr:hypothetical protein [Elusimicrobiota bacterium]